MKAYLIERDPYGEGAEVLAVYFGKEIAEHAVSLDKTTELAEIEVSEGFAKTAVQLTLTAYVRTGPDVPMTFNAHVEAMLAEVRESTGDIVDYGANGVTASNIFEHHPYGWGPDGNGIQSTIVVVEYRGTDFVDVRQKFAAALAEVRQKAVTA